MSKYFPAPARSESLLSQPISQKPQSIFWLQTHLLLWKQYLVFTRNLKSTLFQLFTPVFICIFLVLLQQLSNYSTSLMQVKTPDIVSMSKIPKCYGSGCITVGIGYTSQSTSPVTRYVLQYLSEHEDLVLNKDIKVIGTNYTSTIDYLSKHQNKTQTAVLFCTGPFTPPPNPYYNDTINCLNPIPGYNFTIYSMLINSTITPMASFLSTEAPQPIDYASLSVKRAIDNALISYYSGGQNSSVTYQAQAFPAPTERWMDGYNVVTTSGAFYFFIPPMVTFVVILIEVVREKEHRLRHGLAMMGMHPGPYWLSWFCTGLAFIFIVTNTLIFSGLTCQFDLFLHCPYLILILTLGLFSAAMLNLAFLIATALKSTRAAYTASYAFILVGLVLQFLMSDISVIWMIYGDNVQTWVKVSRVLLSLYPPFNFAKAFGNISQIASGHYSEKLKRWVSGDDYTWSDFVSTVYINNQQAKATVPSTATSILTLLGNAAMMAMIAWYLDHVVESNRGSPDRWYFVFTRRYWGCERKTPSSSSKSESTLDSSPRLGTNVKIQESSFVSSFLSEDEGISIKGLGKVYRSNSCCSSSRDIHAVNDLSLEIYNPELLTILGHNGAGKSTLINILTGISSPSYGTATIFGLDILSDMREIRKILGVCPQHDILWDELTAKEHLILFARLKEIPYEEALRDAEEKLLLVKLSHVQNRLVGTFSGGMKRRLSVAISGVGNPRLIILDEPTTGMDPINRRSAWKLIKEMKQNRVVILTTHSMEEADVLSDRVCVVVDGRLSCSGSALYLKNRYGDGFRITLVSKDPKELGRIINSQFPSAKILDSSGGSLVVGIPLNCTSEIQSFFKTMESRNAVSDLIEDWGLSNTTLEEVFMRVTGKKEKALDEA